MAASTVQNPVVKTESKSAKKKKAKAEAPADSQSVETPEANQAADPVESTNGDSEYESPYIKELYKNIRNVNKKISNASKVDGIIAENSGKSLEELVSSKKINADQKAQVLKKPALQAQLAQYEEQIAQYKKFDEDYKSRALADKTQLEKTLKDGASKELREALAAAKKDSQKSASAQSQQSLLLVSQFLRLAAVRRGEEQDEESEENKALEGLLAAVYTGNAQAVSAMTSLIEGSSNVIRGVDGQETSITFSKIKDLAVEAAQEQEPEQEIEPVGEEVASSTAEDTTPQSDPTIANASLTEINADQTAPLSSQAATTEVDDITQNSGFGEGVNAAAQANWDQNNDLSASQEWVEVPRDAAETETGVVATPAAPANTQSWADDTPESPKQQKSTPPEANNNDGFHEVQRSRGPNRNQQQQQQGGPYRGRGGRGDGRGGRGFFRGRGDGRGRGRGGQDRGGRRAEADAQ